MRLSRRNFLHLSSALAAGAAFLPSYLLAAESISKRHIILGALVGGDETMCRVHLATNRADSVTIGFKGHSYIQNPKNPDQFWTFEKWGPHAALVDFKEGQIISRLDAGTDRPFFGHAAYALDSGIIYAMRYDYADAVGYVTGYDTTTYKKVIEYKATTGSPHDCRMMDDGTLMIGSNGNKLAPKYPAPTFIAQLEPSALVRFDLSNGKVLHKMVVKDSYQLASHFKILKDGSVLAVTKSNFGIMGSHGKVYFGKMGDDELKPVMLPVEVQDKLQDEVLSLDVDEERALAVISNPAGRTLMVVDARSGTFLRAIENPAKCVSFDPDSKTFYTAGGSLYALDRDVMHIAPVQVRLTGEAAGDMPSFVSSHSLLV